MKLEDLACVDNNIEKFPERYCFRITEKEYLV